jgi:hypothetical protein
VLHSHFSSKIARCFCPQGEKVKIHSPLAKAAFAAFIATTPALSFADTFFCDGPVGYIALNNTGALTVSFGHGEQYLCSMSEAVTQTPVTPALCKTYHTQVLAAKALGKQIRMFYNTADGRTPNPPTTPAIATNCTQVAAQAWNWPNPAPYHFAILD